MVCTRTVFLLAVAVVVAASCLAGVEGRRKVKIRIKIKEGKRHANDDSSTFTDDSSGGTFTEDQSASSQDDSNSWEALGNLRQNFRNLNDAWRAFHRNASAPPNILNEYKVPVNVTKNYIEIWNNNTVVYLQ